VSTDREAAQLVWVEQRCRAEATLNRGVLALALVPVGLAAGGGVAMAIGSHVALVLAAMYTVFGGFLGVLWLVTGLLRVTRATRALRALDERIPTARLVK
jgi:hypothetical protein